MGTAMLLIISILYLFSPDVLSITIENNAYKGIYISSSNGWTDQNLQKLKEVLTKSSDYLYHATRSRSFFGEFVVSDTWCHTPPSTVPHRVDVYVTADDSEDTALRTQHSKGCGEEGEVIYMPIGWLMQGETNELARQFVQQWSIYRYGVFEENSNSGRSCYRSKDSWNPVGCYEKTKVTEVSPEFENGLPFCHFDLNDTSLFDSSKSSLMFTGNVSKALQFCDGSSSYPHDPVMPTLHNNLCEGKTTWSVIENSSDFKFGKNMPLNYPQTTVPSFTGFCQKNMQLTFAIQNNTRGKDLTEAVTEIGYSLYQYLSSIKERSSLASIEVNVVMFSDQKDDSGALRLDLADDNLKGKIVDYVKSFRIVSENCVSCGFKKAVEASKSGSPSTIIIIAWEDTMGDESPSEILKVIHQRSSDTRFHLVLVENTDADVLSSDLINGIRSTGGQVFFLPKNLVSMATAMHAVLHTAVKRPLQVEDEDAVVHEATFENIAVSFKDSFVTLNPGNGTLEYILHCQPPNRIVPTLQSCVHTLSTFDTYKCVQELQPNKTQLWEFTHTYKGGTKSPNCSSVAVLHKILPSSSNGLTLRGWLNTYTIEPGKDALIVYAEIIGSSAEYRVTAEISGSDSFLASIELRDNGNGDPDVKRGDGVFSRYFTPSSLKKGSYGVKIFAETKFDVPDNAIDHKGVNTARQSKNIGFFSVLESFPDTDIFPPNRVGDLRAVSYDPDNGSVTLQWTAPGNDYDSGTAKTYEVYYSEDWKDLQDAMLLKKPPKRLQIIEINSPNQSGKEDENTFQAPQLGKDHTFYIALRAVDESQNKGKLSNIIQVVVHRPELNWTNNVTNNTEITTESVTDMEAISVQKCYYILAGVSCIIILIVLVNILLWIFCFRKLKKNSKKYNDLKVTDMPNENVSNLKDDTKNKNAHSYVNPIMSDYTAVNNTGNITSTQTSVLYTKTNKQRIGNVKPDENVGETTLPRHSERDMGLV